MKVYDADGSERDFAWLEATFGPQVEVTGRPETRLPGFEVAELRASLGPCAIVVKVLDEDGKPIGVHRVARWWDNPLLPELPDGLNTWRPRGYFGLTSERGDIGFGMGQGDGYDPGSGNLPVSEVWAEGNSANVHGLGWVWGTDHLHIDVTFQWVEAGAEPPEEPPDEPGNCDERLTAIEDELAALATELDDIRSAVVGRLDLILAELRRMQ